MDSDNNWSLLHLPPCRSFRHVGILSLEDRISLTKDAGLRLHCCHGDSLADLEPADVYGVFTLADMVCSR